VAFANPVQHIERDLRADARGMLHSLEYIAHEAKG
jgi:hypothetical protein